ncbi:MAG: disulfide bond formation protein B [Kangiellaceae bacterium]|nr:disulfide bond formation protein B [Kangiellaceae bacterium]
MNLNTRGWNFLGAFICYQLIVTALYFQYVDGLDPCPLCIFQRVAVLALGIVLLVNALHNPTIHSLANKIYQILGLLAALVGVGIAGRHVYLQSLPEGEAPACGAPLDLMMDVLPFMEVIQSVLTGSGECAKISWQFWGISMPGWMLIIFIIAALVMLMRLVQAFRRPKYY